ncbi:GNAT family N-acetyltransferase [Nocardioides sp.]|uniref:GNAT family N-acetyltransferase n=1 Tax=Nocardioides sp. TaxID=35761 RepID=UPI002ED1550B
MSTVPDPGLRQLGEQSAAASLSPGLRLVRVGWGHPDALTLIEAVQEEYVVRYGGRDDTPLDPVMFDPPRGSFFVGYDGGVPVASGAWRRREDVEAFGNYETAEIKRMFVVPEARGRGHARTVLAHLERTAAAAGARAMVLETGTAQPEAIALYESSGYTRIERFGHYRWSPENRCFGKLL